MARYDENRRSHTLLPRKSKPTNEREQNQACLYFAERGGGRRSQPRDADRADCGDDKSPTATYSQGWTTCYIKLGLCCYMSLPQYVCQGRRTDNVDDLKAFENIMNKVYTISFPEARNVVVSGDIHGDFNLLVYKLCVQIPNIHLISQLSISKQYILAATNRKSIEIRN